MFPEHESLMNPLFLSIGNLIGCRLHTLRTNTVPFCCELDRFKCFCSILWTVARKWFIIRQHAVVETKNKSNSLCICRVVRSPGDIFAKRVNNGSFLWSNLSKVSCFCNADKRWRGSIEYIFLVFTSIHANIVDEAFYFTLKTMNLYTLFQWHWYQFPFFLLILIWVH